MLCFPITNDIKEMRQINIQTPRTTLLNLAEVTNTFVFLKQACISEGAEEEAGEQTKTRHNGTVAIPEVQRRKNHKRGTALERSAVTTTGLIKLVLLEQNFILNYGVA